MIKRKTHERAILRPLLLSKKNKILQTVAGGKYNQSLIIETASFSPRQTDLYDVRIDHA